MGGGRWEGQANKKSGRKQLIFCFQSDTGGRCRPTPVNTCDWHLPCLPRRSGNSAQEVCCHCRRPPCSLRPCLKQPLPSTSVFRRLQNLFNIRQSSSSFRQAELFTDFRRKSSPVPFGKASRLQPCPTRKLPEPSQRILLPWSWIARGASRPPMHLWRTNRTSLSKTSVATPRRSFSPSIPSPRMWGVK